MEKKFFLSKYLIFIILFLCGILFSGTVVFAATDNVPKTINVQGRLTTDSGSPITGTKSVTLAIYSDSSGTSQIASKTNSSVNVDSEGLYTVNFDFASDNIDFNRQLYFKVTANGVESSVTPFSASPNAFYASTSTYALSLSTAEGADKLVSGNFTTYKGSEDPYIYEVKVDSSTYADVANTANNLSSSFKIANENFDNTLEYSNLILANSNFADGIVYNTTTTWSQSAVTVADGSITPAKMITGGDYSTLYDIRVSSADWALLANTATVANSLSSSFKLVDDNFTEDYVYATTSTWSSGAGTVSDGAITTAKVADANITPAKLTSGLYGDDDRYDVKVSSAVWADTAGMASNAATATKLYTTGTSGQVWGTNSSGEQAWVDPGSLAIPIATDSVIGGVKVPSANGLSVAGNGTLSITVDASPTASSTNLLTSGVIYSTVTKVYTDMATELATKADTSALSSYATTEILQSTWTQLSGLISTKADSSELANYQTLSNLVTSIDSSSENDKYPSALAVYNVVSSTYNALNANKVDKSELGTYVTLDGAETLMNKTLALTNNTITGLSKVAYSTNTISVADISDISTTYQTILPTTGGDYTTIYDIKVSSADWASNVAWSAVQDAPIIPIVDTEMSLTSENTVQNKVITSTINVLIDSINTKLDASEFAKVWNGSVFNTKYENGGSFAQIFNESDGGGTMYYNNTSKIRSYIGVHDGGSGFDSIYGQIYAVDTSDSNRGTRINLTKGGIYYTNGKTNASFEATDEIATKGDLANITAAKLGAGETVSSPTKVWATDGTNQGWVDLATNTGTNGQVVGSGADLAEIYASSETLVPGDVVSIDTTKDNAIVKTKVAEDTLVAGVISTEPGVLLNKNEKGYKLALVGKVPTKVCNEGGNIKRGDMLVSASIPGYAKKAGDNPKAGTVIGKALENFDAAKGSILVLVNLQ